MVRIKVHGVHACTLAQNDKVTKGLTQFLVKSLNVDALTFKDNFSDIFCFVCLFDEIPFDKINNFGAYVDINMSD